MFLAKNTNPTTLSFHDHFFGLTNLLTARVINGLDILSSKGIASENSIDVNNEILQSCPSHSSIPNMNTNEPIIPKSLIILQVVQDRPK